MAALSADDGPPAPGGPREGRLVVALVRGLHGLSGAVRVESLTDRPSERFARGRRLHREGSDEVLTIAASAVDGPGWRLRFEEIADRTAAESLRGAYLEAELEPGDELARGEYYWHEVIGATVRDLADRPLGTVVDVYRAGGVDAYVVRGEPYGEFDLPALRDFIRVFAPRRGEIVVDAEALELTPARPHPQRAPRPRRATRRRPPVAGGPARSPDAPARSPDAPSRSPDGPSPATGSTMEEPSAAPAEGSSPDEAGLGTPEAAP